MTYIPSCISSPNGIKSHCYDVIYKEIVDKYISDEYKYVVFIDGISNNNINLSNPLNFLHEILDYGIVLNESVYRKKKLQSLYEMDFANVNRIVLIYTDLPDIDEILNVFEFDAEKIKVNDVKSFIDSSSGMVLSRVRAIFQNLWPKTEDKEFNMPKTIALR